MGLEEKVNGLYEWYFRPRKIEKTIYEFLGVPQWKKYIWKPLKNILPGPKLDSYSAEGIKKAEKESRYYELFYTGLAIALPFVLGLGPAVVAVNSIVNTYPAMLQRYNRIRMYEIISRKESGQENKP